METPSYTKNLVKGSINQLLNLTGEASQVRAYKFQL